VLTHLQLLRRKAAQKLLQLDWNSYLVFYLLLKLADSCVCCSC
jgi:hypothetical protein